MPHQTEPNVNNALGSLLQAMLPKSDVRSENTRAIAGQPGLRPDILITASDRAPVVVEAEYMPAMTVEPETRERLGLEVAVSGRIIEAVIAPTQRTSAKPTTCGPPCWRLASPIASSRRMRRV